jgi:hypothetical protein
LRSEDAGDKFKFYVLIGKKTPSVFKKRAQSFSADISFSQRFKTNLSPIYNEINLKNYYNHIKECSLYFKNYTRVFLTKIERITHIIIFTKNILRNKWARLNNNKKSIIWKRYYDYMKIIITDPENRKLLANMKLKILKQKPNQLMRNLLHELKLIETDLSYKISDKQKAYHILTALSPNLSKDVINEIKSKITSRDQITTIAQRYKKDFKNQFFNNISSRNKNGKNKNNSRFNSRSGNIDSRNKKKKKKRGNRTTQQNLIYYYYNKSEYKKFDYPDLKISSNLSKN